MSCTCLICNQICNGFKGLGSHVVKLHKIKSKQYYDTYIDNSIHYCVVCHKPTKFLGLKDGYAIHCSNRCAQLDPKIQEKSHQTKLLKYGDPTFTNRQKAINTMKELYNVENISQLEGFGDKVKQTKLKRHGNANYNNREQAAKTCLEKYNVINPYQIDQIKEKAYQNNYNQQTYQTRTKTNNQILDNYEKYHNCTRLCKLVKQYGQGFLRIYDNLTIYHFHHSTFIDNNDIDKIIQYNNNYHCTSRLEENIYNYLKSIYSNQIIRRSRQIIKPFELDIYLPDLQLAIEVNGTFWHSINNGLAKDYHLKKSLLCRKYNIRLIHIYEFEDINTQKQLLKNLIFGQDNYNQNDFNKNNLNQIIPKPQIIYNNRFTIYGAGKLY